MLNGCLYADEKLISAYYTGEVAFNRETRQVTLQTKDSTVPLLAVKEISGEKDGRSYQVEVPVIVGLNDSNFEKNLNKSMMEKMQAYVETYLTAEEQNGQLQLKVQMGMCTKNFLSFWWEGTEDGVSIKMAENIDLLGQKTVTLADMLDEASLKEVQTFAGEGWTAEYFFLTAEGGLVLLKGSNEGGLELHYWTTEGKQFVWKDAYKDLFQK